MRFPLLSPHLSISAEHTGTTQDTGDLDELGRLLVGGGIHLDEIGSRSRVGLREKRARRRAVLKVEVSSP